jgi:hypothetical protein
MCQTNEHFCELDCIEMSPKKIRRFKGFLRRFNGFLRRFSFAKKCKKRTNPSLVKDCVPKWSHCSRELGNWICIGFATLCS